MNREIKFRAWARDGKWNEDGDKMEFVMIDSDSLMIMGNRPLKDELKDIDDDIYYMQFTGLHDKNGKEIYEGDIVRYYQPYAKRTDTHIVKWDNKWAGFGLFENNNEWCVESDWVKIKDIEIIGNIYETPELLNIKP